MYAINFKFQKEGLLLTKIEYTIFDRRGQLVRLAPGLKAKLTIEGASCSNDEWRKNIYNVTKNGILVGWFNIVYHIHAIYPIELTSEISAPTFTGELFEVVEEAQY